MTFSGFQLAALALVFGFHAPSHNYKLPVEVRTTNRQATSQSEELQPGRIIQRVVCKDNAGQTYALYLPSNYSSQRMWPLIAAFDPAARGVPPVERFKEAAERYGYIVCGSNNSRNGPWGPTAEAAQAMLNDVTARFPIDDKRLYVTGFSGGARVATSLAVALAGRVAGVIGCGAGFPPGLQAASSLPFVYYGTIGNEDFNYPEMKLLDRALDSAGVPHHIEVFEGGHSWAPADACVRAVQWMELQAMKTGRHPRDDAFIDGLFKSAEDSAAAHESAGRTYEAYLGCAAIAADFRGLKDVASFEKKAALLRNSKAVTQALSKDREQETEQRRRVTELFALRARLRDSKTSAALGEAEDPIASGKDPISAAAEDSDARERAIVDLRRKLSDLKRKTEATENSPERALARRMLGEYTIALFEQSMTLIQTRKYELAASNLAIDAEVMPDNWRVWYNLACAYALKGDKRRAVAALSTAVQKGFASAAEVERNSQLDAIREEPGFKKIVEALKQKQ